MGQGEVTDYGDDTSGVGGEWELELGKTLMDALEAIGDGVGADEAVDDGIGLLEEFVEKVDPEEAGGTGQEQVTGLRGGFDGYGGELEGGVEHAIGAEGLGSFGVEEVDGVEGGWLAEGVRETFDGWMGKDEVERNGALEFLFESSGELSG